MSSLLVKCNPFFFSAYLQGLKKSDWVNRKKILIIEIEKDFKIPSKPSATGCAVSSTSHTKKKNIKAKPVNSRIHLDSHTYTCIDS